MTGPPRVLVVDDVPMNRHLLGVQLRNAGCDVLFAADGAQALATLAASACALVIMDCRMPVLDGIEAARRLRAHETARQLARTPIIALSAAADDEAAAACAAAGIDALCSKPLRVEQLDALLAAWIGWRAQ